MAKKVQIDIVAKDKASKQMKGIGKSAGTMGAAVKKAALAFVAMGAAVGVAMGKAIKDWAAAGDQIQKMALRTGIATEALSELKYAAEISGASIEDLEKAFKRMSKTVVDASEGMATYIRAFNRIGLEVKDLMGLRPEDMFMKIAMAIGRLTDETTMAATAQDIFGRAGTALLPLIKQGIEGINELREQAKKLGIVFTQFAADQAAEFTDAMKRINETLRGIKYTILQEIMPAMEVFLRMLESAAKREYLLSEESLTYTKILEGQRKVGIEYLKVLRGEENQYIELARTQRQLIYNYLSLKESQIKATKARYEGSIIYAKFVIQLEKELNLITETRTALEKTGQALNPYLIQMQEYEESVEAQNEALAAQKELIDANKKAREEYAKVLQNEIERIKELLEIQRRAAAMRLERAGRIMEQIQAAGGMVSPERARAYYEQMERETAIQRYRAQFGERQARLGAYPEMGGGDIYLDGERVGEVTSRRMGESFLQESHMSGGD